uniref:O-fucosyltransferase family protein n=4 Tax=Aegilops tauschii TaxID=37682 RepID=A0A453S2S4_AEGTS
GFALGVYARPNSEPSQISPPSTMDPSRPLLGRGAFLSSSAHAAAAIILIAFLLLTLLRLPLSPSISIYTPAPLASTPHHHLQHQDHEDQEQEDASSCDLSSPLDCADPRLFHLMMRSAIDAFPAVHFARFGRPVPGDPPSASCDMAWRARTNASASASPTATTKDYRRFAIARDPHTCAYSVTSIGDYHSGPNARKPRPGASNATAAPPPPPLSRSQFAAATYLSYHGGGDRCKLMPHYMRSLLCALAEARYLNRTLVLDLSLCLAASYTAAGMPEEGKRLAFYFDIDHLRSSVVNIIEERQFWEDWDRWGAQGQLGLRLIEDTRVAATKFSKAKDTLIVRKFGDVEPGNYWYHVCEGEAERVLPPPRHAIRLAPSLMSIVDDIILSMQQDFDSVHVGGSVEDLIQRIEDGVDVGRQVYIAGEGINTVSMEVLKAKYNNLRYLDEFQRLWRKDSKWFLEMKRLNGGVPVKFDGYMRELVDREVFLKGKKKVEVLR